MSTAKLIEVKDLAPLLYTLGFNCDSNATYLSSSGYHLSSNVNISVRPPRGSGYNSYIPSVIFEANRSRGHRGRFFSKAKLVVRAKDFHKLAEKFNAWLPGAIAISDQYNQRQADLQEKQRLSRAAIKNYAESLGVDSYRVTTDVDGVPVGIKIELAISGKAPEEALRKLRAVRKVPEILDFLERTQTRLQGELLPLPVSIREEITELLTNLTKEIL